MTTYETVLAELWAAARAPRKPGAPTVVSLFAGGGGSSTGYKAAGYDVRLAVEWSKYPAACYRLNYPETHVWEGDVSKFGAEQAMEMARIAPGELDILDGSPPCQGFSTAGKRLIGDPRNSLFKEHVRLLRGLRPRAFVLENVSGLVKGSMLWVFGHVLEELRASNYRVSCRLMDAKWYGVPQTRRRTIFVGVREDLVVEPSHPQPQVVVPRTVADACPWLGARAHQAGGRPAGSRWNPYNKRFDVAREPCNTISKSAGNLIGAFTSGGVAAMKPAPTIQKGGIAASSSTQFAVDMALPDGPASYMPSPPLSEQAQAIYASIRPGQKGNVSAAAAGKNVFFSKQRLAAARPSPTIVKTAIGMGIHEMCPPNSVRGLSIGEVRRLCSFPDQYEFVQTGKPRKDWVDAWGIMGNSVPPLLMRAVAEHIRNEILAVAH